MNTLDAALEYAQRGWAVVPLHHVTTAGACSCARSGCRSAGKHPRPLHGALDASADPDVIRQWWRRWPRANVGLATGEVSGFDVLDVDPRHGGDTSLAGLEQRYGALPPSVESVTGGGGRHILFLHDDALNANLGDGLDVRTSGHQIVAPPSLHLSGRQYAWDLSSHPDDVPIAPWPQWALSSTPRKPRLAPVRTGPRSGRQIPDGRWQRILTGCKRLRELEAEQVRHGVSYDEWLTAVAVARLGGAEGQLWALEFTESYPSGASSDDLMRLAGWLSGNLAGTATCVRLGCHPGLCGFRPRADGTDPSPLRHAYARIIEVDVA